MDRIVLIHHIDGFSLDRELNEYRAAAVKAQGLVVALGSVCAVITFVCLSFLYVGSAIPALDTL